MKNILVPTDFSACSLNALNYAYRLACREGGSIVLLHTHELPFFTFTQEEHSANVFIKNAERVYLDKLKHAVEEITGRYGEGSNNVKFEYIVKHDGLIKNIKEAGDEKNCDLIIMGTHGAQGFKEFFIGSHTAKVVEKSTLPILIIPEEAGYKPIEKIVYTTAVDEHNFQEIEYLVQLADLFSAEIKVLYVDNRLFSRISDRYLLDKVIKEKFDYVNVTRAVIEDQDVEHGINNYIKEHNVDILAMLRRERPLLNSVFHVSMTRKLTHHTKIPLLILHEHHEA